MDAISSLTYITPELILIGGALIILFLDLAKMSKRWLGLLSLLFLVAAFCSITTTGFTEITKLFFGFWVLDGLSYVFKILILLMIGIPILASIDSSHIPENQKGEFFTLMLFMGFLLTMMASTTNLLMIFLATESVSLTSYILTGFQKYNKRSAEASLKYFLFGSVSSAIMLFGISLIFGLTGTLELAEIPNRIHTIGTGALPCALTSLFLMLVGLGFKISAAPFHMWAPDVYEGAPTPVSAFLTVAPKSIGFVILFRVLLTSFSFLQAKWSAVLVVLSILTMTLGNVIAISQYNMKRLLAYSSIAQAGYILMGLAVSNTIGKEAVFLYLATYLFTNMGAFLTISIIEQSEGTSDLSALNGLSKRNPLLAGFFTVFMLSLAGIPPLAGFIAKWYVFAGAIQAGFLALAIAAAINSAIAGFYYFKAIRAMYLTPATQTSPVISGGLSFLAITISFIGVIVIGLFPSPLIQFLQNTITF